MVMDIEAFARRESMLRLRENLIAAEEGRLNGNPGHSIDEVSGMMKEAVKQSTVYVDAVVDTCQDYGWLL